MNSLTILATLLGLASSGADPAIELTTAVADYRVAPREYRLDGVVEAVSQTTVSAQTQGQVKAILYDVDDFVERDAVVARLKDTEQRARLAQAQADLDSAQARLDNAADEFERLQGLFAKEAISESSMDKALAERKAAKAAVEAATARLEQATEQLAYTELRAPYSGIVTKRHVEVGEIANPGTPVMSGVSLDELRVAVDVPQSVIPAVRRGGRVRIYLGGKQAIEAAKLTVFPFADPKSNTFVVRADLPAGSHGLFPGMYVKTGFVVGQKRELTIPAAAVVYRSEVTAVYVVDGDGKVGFRHIRAGRAVGDAVVVLSGLQADERVALDPVAAAVRLKAQRDGAASGASREDGHD